VANTVVQATTEGVGFSVSTSSAGPVFSSPVASRARGSASRRNRARREPFTERYLIRIVSRFRTCLTAIATREARALTLRTGIGARRSYSRRDVARILGVSLGREGQIERQAVGALQTAAGDGFCAGATRAGVLLAENDESSLLAAELPTPLATRAPASSARREHRGKKATPSGSAHTVSGASAAIPLPPPPSGSSFTELLLILLAAAAAVVVVTVIARRGMLRSRLAAAGPDAVGAGAVAGAVGAGAVASAAAARQRRLRQDTAVRERIPQDALAAYRASGAPGELVAAAGLRGAIAALRRADDRGDPAGAAGLGVVFEQQGDLDGAVAAYRRADERGHLPGTLRLGALLERQGDSHGAIDAYRRADERGNAVGSLNLGRLLGAQGDEVGAIAAFRRARERGDREVSEAARAAWLKLMED
jgi:hypothetical protein